MEVGLITIIICINIGWIDIYPLKSNLLWQYV